MRRTNVARFLLSAALLSTAAVFLSPVSAQRAARKPVVTAEQKTAALAFAREHHPELAKLLEQLQDADPDGYREAVLDVSKDSERLLRIQERTPDRYDHELALWKIDSRIRLAAAQSAMGDPEETRAELRELLLERNAVKLQLLRVDRERLAGRLERMDATIEQLESEPEATAERELGQLLKRARTRVEQATRPERKSGKTSPTSTKKPGGTEPK